MNNERNKFDFFLLLLKVEFFNYLGLKIRIWFHVTGSIGAVTVGWM